MTFIEEARSHIESVLADVQNRLRDYVHRSILREGSTPLEAEMKKAFETDDSLLLADRDLIGRQLVLIGNSGSGKTLILLFAYQQAALRFLTDDAAPFPLLLDLSKELSTGQNIEDSLNNWNRGLFNRSKEAHPPGCAIFFDELDGALRKSGDFINNFAFFIRRQGADLKQLIACCQRSAWDAAWLNKLTDGLAIYNSDYLNDESYEEIIIDRRSLRQFREQCQSLGISGSVSVSIRGV